MILNATVAPIVAPVVVAALPTAAVTVLASPLGLSVHEPPATASN